MGRKELVDGERLKVGREVMRLRNEGIKALEGIGYPSAYAERALNVSLVSNMVAEERLRLRHLVYTTRQGVLNCLAYAEQATEEDN